MPAFISIPPIECGLNETVLYDLEKEKNRIIRATIIGVTSHTNHSLSFHVVVEESGAIFSYVPIFALWNRSFAVNDYNRHKLIKNEVIQYDYESLDYHFCPDNNIEYAELEGLKDRICWSLIKVNNEFDLIKGTYFGTFNWPNGNIIQNLILLASGQFALVPNHKLYFTRDKPEFFPSYKKLRKSWV